MTKTEIVKQLATKYGIKCVTVKASKEVLEFLYAHETIHATLANKR